MRQDIIVFIFDEPIFIANMIKSFIMVKHNEPKQHITDNPYQYNIIS